MKVLMLLCAILLAVVATTADVQAYSLSNTTMVQVNRVFVETSCGRFGPFSLPPGMGVSFALPPGCTVLGIRYRGVFRPVGFNGAIPPPNPPNGITVTASGATFW